MTNCAPEIFGADPAVIRWAIVRGDTSTIKIEFLDSDEVTYFDTSDWTYRASAYDKKTDILDELVVTASSGFVTITALPELTSYWGTTYSRSVAELEFDLEVTIGDVVWTPVIGTISVIGDVSGGL